jgi:hypothetical protein
MVYLLRNVARASQPRSFPKVIRKLIVPSVVALVAVASPVQALDTATKPAIVKGVTRLYLNDVASTVTVDGPAVIKMTNLAFRHPEKVQVTRVVTKAGTYTIRDRCQPYRLAHTWIVYVDGVKVASAKLRCR